LGCPGGRRADSLSSSGARGYLLKDADQDDLLRAIGAVARGEAIFGPAIAGRLVGYFAAAGRGGAPRRSRS
jgi:DNA-binding NarL/FixJ family response regulator